MKKAMSTKKRRILFLITGLIWTVVSVLHLWWMIDKWEIYGGESIMEMRGLTFVLSVICAILNFVNCYRWKSKEE